MSNEELTIELAAVRGAVKIASQRPLRNQKSQTESGEPLGNASSVNHLKIMKNWKTIVLNLLQLSGYLAASLAIPSPDTAAILALIPQDIAAHIGKIALGLIAAKPAINIAGDLIDNGELDKSWPPVVVLALCLALGLSACATDTNGNKKYVGPSFGVSAGYQGVTLGFQLYGEPSQFAAKTVVPLESGTVALTAGQAVELPNAAK